jgi:hypothetical protein
MNLERPSGWVSIQDNPITNTIDNTIDNIKNNKAEPKKNGSYYQGPNNQFYYIEITLYNQIQGQLPLNVPFFLVESLTIHESLFNWAVKGEIVFNTDFEVFSRGAPDSNKPPYIDRNDGRNRVHIRIHPVDVTMTDGNITEGSTETKFPTSHWEMDHDFIVSEIKDIPVDNNQRKKRMYVLIDEKKQIMMEKNLEWSGELLALKKQNLPLNTILKDSEAVLNPNEALKELLTLISTNGDTMPKINVGFDGNGDIQKPNIEFDKIDEANWDVGNPENKVLFYTTAKKNALEDINSILAHCVSYDGFPVILDYGRSSEDKAWTLKSLTEYFKNSTQEQVEKLIIEDGLMPLEDLSVSPYVSRAYNGESGPINNFSSIAASRITSYKYSPMAPIDDNRIQNSPLYYWDEHTGYFNAKKQNNSIIKVVEKLDELAKSGLYSFQQGNNAQILLAVNRTKSSGQMTNPQSALNGPYSSHVSPLISMIMDSLFLGQSISFQCLGLTLRSPGKFIFIDRLGAGEKNAFDDRFLGQWMITDVSHLFTQDTYTTQVFANKIDSFSSVFPVADANY